MAADTPAGAPAEGTALTPAAALDVVDFWRQAGIAGLWFRKDADFDRDFRERFLALHMAAARGELNGWSATAEGTVALLVLLDQFPRNAFRGTGHMFATDPLARRIARAALAAGVFDRLEAALRLFLCLPFSHSEDLADQELAVRLNRQLGDESLRHAEEHRDIIARFGRFPHRNPALGRETTADEAEFLRAGGFAG